MTDQLALTLTGGTTRGRITWSREPYTCGATHHMLIDGERSGIYVQHCGHPTALRPYYIAVPTETPGEELHSGRKYKYLADAKAAAIHYHTNGDLE